MITTVVVTSQRPQLLKRCLLSLASEKASVIVVINGPDENSESRALCQDLFYVHLPVAVTPAEARNMALQHVSTPWIHFLDDDAYVYDGFYKKAEEVIKTRNVDVIGGPNLTPPNSGFFQKLSGLALASPWGAGPCHKRYSDRSRQKACGEEALILCNLLVRKKAFETHRFPRKFFCGEENSFLAKLKKQGNLFFFSSDLYVWHERREESSAFLKQIWHYGVGRGQNILQGDFTFHHTVPLLALGVFSFYLFHPWTLLFKICFALYVVLNFYFAISLTFKNSLGFRGFALCLVLFPPIHFQYAVGCLWGMTVLSNVFESGASLFKALKLSTKKNFE